MTRQPIQNPSTPDSQQNRKSKSMGERFSNFGVEVNAVPSSSSRQSKRGRASAKSISFSGKLRSPAAAASRPRCGYFMDTPELRPVVGYENFYSVSSDGMVYSKRGRSPGVMIHIRKKKGYLAVRLSVGKKHKSRLVHRLVAQAFIPNPLEKPQVNHKDGIKNNNSVTNLEWVTNSENAAHAVSCGLIKIGEQHPRAKLTKKKIEEILLLDRQGHSANQIAQSFGISKYTVRAILGGKSWTHVARVKPKKVYFSKHQIKFLMDHGFDVSEIG